MIQAAQEQATQHQVTQQQAAAVAEVAAQLAAAQVTSPTEIAAIAQRVGVAPAELAAAIARVGSPAAAVAAQQVAQQQLAQLAAAPTTTLRTALLSWDVDPAGSPSLATATQTQASEAARPASPIEASHSAAHAMIDALSMPMLGDGATAGSPAWTGPGMVAERARSWSVAQERSAADLSFDFVSPELVLAARVYGLGPAEAAQAARLAVAGPGHISAMANAVDRTFVQAMAIEADRRHAITTAYPSGPNEISAAIAPLRTTAAVAPVVGAPTGLPATSALAPTTTPAFSAPPAASSSSFGVERRLPRGAFLWPSASVGALGLNAAAPDGEQSMSVAALELLAAQAVAELGTYAALADRAPTSTTGTADVQERAEADGQTPTAQPTPATQVARAMAAQAAQANLAVSTEAGVAALYHRGDSSEADVLASAAALVPMSRRARFDALYVALSQSPNGRSWSPAARAARAFALAGHGASDDAQSLSVHERAMTAWDVLPVVYATSVDTEVARDRGSASSSFASGSASSSKARGAVANRRTGNAPNLEQVVDTRVDTRPGLASLSARAGEALGSYVSPTVAPSSSSSSSSSSSGGAVTRAPTAAQELVRTGRPAGRHGGGEVEIPTWFEAAARKMLEDRSSASDGISLAELTLVQAAPAHHVAASTVKPSSATSAPSHAAQDADGSPHKLDVEKLANEVYRHIMHMLDVARARNGEPYL